MPKRFQKQRLRRAILKCLTVGSISMATLVSINTKAEVCDVIYGVHDEGLNDSQLVTITPPNYGVNELGTAGSGFLSRSRYRRIRSESVR
jgi:hypothetical protein